MRHQTYHTMPPTRKNHDPRHTTPWPKQKRPKTGVQHHPLPTIVTWAAVLMRPTQHSPGNVHLGGTSKAKLWDSHQTMMARLGASVRVPFIGVDSRDETCLLPCGGEAPHRSRPRPLGGGCMTITFGNFRLWERIGLRRPGQSSNANATHL